MVRGKEREGERGENWERREKKEEEIGGGEGEGCARKERGELGARRGKTGEKEGKKG